MKLSTLELFHIRSALSSKVIHGHGNTEPYQELYDKVGDELKTRGCDSKLGDI